MYETGEWICNQLALSRLCISSLLNLFKMFETD